MKLYKRLKRGRSVFVSYAISFMSIVLLSCLLVGALLFWFSVRDLRTSAIKDSENRLHAAVEDFERQLDSMRSIALNLSQTEQFRPSYFRRNKYYETELLNYFKQYRQALVISQDYFLVYHDADTVFQSNGNSNSFQAYAKYLLNLEPSQELWTWLCEPGIMSVLPGEENYLLFSFAVNTKPVYSSNGNATLCYIVKRDDVENRLLDITGELDGKIALYYDDILITPHALEDAEEIIRSQSSSGRISLRLELSPENILNGFSFFSTTSLILTVVLVVVLLLSAFAAAYRIYLPIRALSSKYAREETSKKEAGNELKNIDTLLGSLVKKEELTEKQLREQLAILKEQMLRLIVKGNYYPSLQNRLKLLGIKLDGLYYCILSCRIREGVAGTRRSLQEVIFLIEDLSESEMAFYPISEEPQSVTVLLNLKEAYLAEEARELLYSLFEAEGFEVKIGRGEIYDNLQQVPASYLEAVSDTVRQERVPVPDYEKKEWGPEASADQYTYNSALVSRMIHFVREGNLEQAKNCLAALSDSIRDISLSILARKYIYSDVATLLVRASREMNHPLSERQISVLLTADDGGLFFGCIEDILVYWDEALRKDIIAANEKNTCRIVRHIRENCTRYDLSLDSISQEFGVSPTYLSRLIKDATGENYRDFLASLRMEAAKRLLTEENASVADACQKVGYANISHFIKMFRRATGMTPARYRDEYGAMPNSEKPFCPED